MKIGPVIPMRPAIEVQRAHDLLVGIILKEVPLKIPEDGEEMKLLHGAAGVLCWVLRHDHNDKFAVCLQELERATQSMGFTLKQEP
jgi:hypothetical protein